MTTATIALVDGTVHQADIQSVYYREAEVYESRSRSYSSMSYPYYRSQSVEIKTPVVTHEAEISFRVGDQAFSVGESKVLSVAVPSGYVRYQNKYMTVEAFNAEVKRENEFWERKRKTELEIHREIRKVQEEHPESLWDKFLGWFR